MLLKKKQVPDKPTVYRDIKPTLMKIGHRFSIIAPVGVPPVPTNIYFLKEDDVLAMLPNDAKVPDFNLRLNLFAPLTSVTFKDLTNTYDCTINQQGFMMFDGIVPTKLSEYETFLRIEGIESLEELSVHVPDVPPDIYSQGEIVPFAYLYIKIAGIPGEVGPVSSAPIDMSTKMAVFPNSSWRIEGVPQVQGVTVVARWLKETTSIVDIGGSGFYLYNNWQTESAIKADFNNAWEDPLLPGGLGLVSGLITVVSLETLRRKLASSSALVKVATSLGVSSMTLAADYLAALVYFTSIAKTRTIEDFSMEELINGPTILASVLKLGLGAAYPLLRQITGDHRASQLSKMLTKALTGVTVAAEVATSFATAAAYLTALGINTYHFYWS